MHIAEGVLSPPVLCAGAFLTACGTALGLKRLATNQIITTGILSALFFLASLIHIPIGISSAHLVGSGIIGIVLGWSAFPAILLALMLQAVFFQFGGITVLGVNTCTMASSAVVSWYFFRLGLTIAPSHKGLLIVSFCTGIIGVASAAFFTAVALAFSEEAFVTAACALFIAHLPIMIAEGFIASFTFSFIARVRPEVLPLPQAFFRNQEG